MNENNAPTRYTEANALLAVQQGDTATAQEILNGMLPHELLQLREAAYDLAELTARTMVSKGNQR